MPKLEPREMAVRPGPARTASGTRVAAARLTPLTPATPPDAPAASDMRSQLPTQRLELDELRAMALKCASDVDADADGFGAALESALPAPAEAVPEPLRPRPRLELVYGDDEPSRPVAPRVVQPRVELRAAVDRQEDAPPPRRLARVVLAVLLVGMTIAAVFALRAYGVFT